MITKDFIENIANGNFCNIEISEFCKGLDDKQIMDLLDLLELEKLSYSINGEVVITNNVDKGCFLVDGKSGGYTIEVQRLDDCITFIKERFTSKQQAAPGPQRENPKPTRGRGRPKETFKDKMIDDTDGRKLQRVHVKINGKKGKDFSLIILACIKKGWLVRPTYTQAKNEFGDIGTKTGYNKYLNDSMFTKEELEGAINSLDHQ